METKDVKEQTKTETKPSKPRCNTNTTNQMMDRKAPTKPHEAEQEHEERWQVKRDVIITFDD